MLERAHFRRCALAMVAAATTVAAAQKPGADAGAVEQIHRLEGQAIVALADAAMRGEPTPSDLAIHWHNDALKAQQGTFVPFVVTIDAPSITTPALLLYLRLASRGPAALAAPDRRRRDAAAARRGADEAAAPEFALEEVYPVDVRGASGQPVRVMRGFSARAGEYDLVVVVRERTDGDNPGLRRKAGVLSRRLTVPDFPAHELSTSSVMMAERLTVLDLPPPGVRPEERPYLIGLSDIQPAADSRFRRDEELIVVFLVYNPFVTPEKKFDVEVEYHFFTKTADRSDGGGQPTDAVARPASRDGERYFNHTKPQRFTPAIMGPEFDPSAGQPLMAGQGVPLAAFPEGDYRLAIRVTDIVTGKSILRDVAFTIVP